MADRLDEIDMLRSQVLALRQDLLTRDRNDFASSLVAKYGKPGDTSITVGPDGTIVRPVPQAPVTLTGEPVDIGT